MYKIYINDHPLVLADSIEAEGLTNGVVLGAVYTGNKKQLLNFIDKLEKSPDPPPVVIAHSNLKDLKEDFWSLFKGIKAAGGVITNEENQALFIHRFGHWDLPKGKRDKGEKNKQAALREVLEEVGLRCTAVEKLPKTYHTYRLENGRRVLKTTAWYKMKSLLGDIVLQEAEGITDFQWLDPKVFLRSKHQSYQSIRDLISKIVG